MTYVLLTVVLACFSITCILLILRLEAEIKSAVMYVGEVKHRGVYRIRCHINGAEYIGSTKSNFMGRWGQHIRDLNKGQHSSPRLQADWNFYGPAAFQFMIIEVMDDDAMIVERERAIISSRAATVPPTLNYNVALSRIYSVPASPEQS